MQPQAGQKLQGVALDKMRANRTRMAVELAALAGLTLLIPALLDYRYFWPLSIRYSAEIVWILLAAVGIWWGVRQWRHLESPKAVALELERRQPQIRCDVSTAAEYSERRVEQHSPLDAELVSALQQRAYFHLGRLPTPYRKRSTALLTLSGITAGLLLLLVVIFPAWRLALQRILLPGTVPQYTYVDVHPGKAEIPTKSDFAVSVRFSGRLPAQSRIEWKSGDSPWQGSVMTPTDVETASYQFKDMPGNFTYRVTANDAISPEYAVTVYPPPEIAALQIDIIPPAYTHLPPQRSTTGDVATLRGSQLRWRLVPTRPLLSAHLHFEKGLPDLDLQAAGDGGWTGGMTLKINSVYQTLLLDTDTHANRNQPPSHLVALPDAPPQVEISSPEVKVVADPNDQIPITVQASDDIGLSSVNLVYQRPGQPNTVAPLLPAGKLLRHLTQTQPLELSPLHLKPYDVVIYYAEARDNNTYDGPGITRSPAHFIIIRGPPRPNTPPPPPSKGGGGGQQINLTQMQRDLISATTLLPDAATRETLQDLATAQREIKGYAEKGNAILQAAQANPAAISAMGAAIDAMDRAETSLESGNQPAALEQEAQALASLLQVLRNAPELASLDGDSAMLTITLDDDETHQAQQQAKQQKLSQALAQAHALQQAQQALKAQGEGKGKSGAGNGQGETASSEGNPGDKKNDPTGLAQRQQALADQARHLADLLNKAAGENPAVSHHLGQTVGQAAGEMDAAAQELQRGKSYDPNVVSVAQGQSIRDLAQVADVLESNLAVTNHQVNVEDESAPPEYADQLARYFKKLSHEK